MKISFDVDGAEDAEAAAAMCLAIVDAIRLYENPELLREMLDEVEAHAHPPVKHPRLPKRAFEKEAQAKKTEAPSVEQVEKPKVPVIVEGISQTVLAVEEARTEMMANAAAPKEKRGRKPKAANGPDGEAAREELRKVAKGKGVAWVRDMLGEHGASRLSELSDEQVHDVLAAA